MIAGLPAAEYYRRWRLAHPDSVRRSAERAKASGKSAEREQRWRLNNPERSRARSRRYYHAHREQEAVRMRDYKARNPQRFLDYERRYYAEHRDRELAMAKAWNHAHVENVRASTSRRNARRKGSTGQHTIAEWLALVEACGGRCAYCGEVRKLTRDHATPLFRGGSDSIDNIRPACLPCNSGKHTMTEAEYRAYRARRAS